MASKPPRDRITSTISPEFICEKVEPMIKEASQERVKLLSVEVREHEGNSAIYMND